MRWTNKPFFRAATGALAVFLFWATPGLAGGSDVTNVVPDALLLKNGDRFDGNLVSIDTHRVVRWKHSDVAEPIEFKLDSVSQIDLHPPSPPARGATYPCRVVLNEGDALEGSLVSCNRESLVLQTWYAGQLKIPRKHLQSVSFLATTPDIFMVTGPEGWTQGAAAGVLGAEAGRWIWRDDAWYADKSASIARNLKLPDSADLQFDLAWTGALTLSLALYTDSLQPILIAEKDSAPDFGAFYSMRFQNMFVDVARIKKNENPVVYLPAVVVPAFSQTNRVHIDIRAQKKSNTLALTVDGQLLQVWKDTNGFAGDGTGVRFVHNLSGQIKISDLRLAPWDGVLDGDPTNIAPPDKDVVWLTNATTMYGVIESVAEGQMTLRGKKDNVEVPLARVRRLTFAPPLDELPKEPEGTIHATFARGGSLAFQLEAWTPEGVTIRSPVFGQAKFDPNAFRKLVFQPLDSAAADKSNSAAVVH